MVCTKEKLSPNGDSFKLLTKLSSLLKLLDWRSMLLKHVLDFLRVDNNILFKRGRNL